MSLLRTMKSLIWWVRTLKNLIIFKNCKILYSKFPNFANLKILTSSFKFLYQSSLP